MSLRSLKYAIFMTPFLLGACGEGYDQTRTDQWVPYGNTRTAGTGIAYVKAKMMPKKELNLSSVKETVDTKSDPVIAEPEPAPEPAVDHEDAMEKLFDEALKK